MSMTGRYLRVDMQEVERIRNDPSLLLSVLYPDPEPHNYAAKLLDIGKTWHVIHFLLNQDPWGGESPRFEAVLGGTPVAEEDLGYGPARHLRPDQVSATAQALQGISPEDLERFYDDSNFSAVDLYWTTDDGAKDYALTNYRALREFFADAAKRGDGMILWLA